MHLSYSELLSQVLSPFLFANNHQIRVGGALDNPAVQAYFTGEETEALRRDYYDTASW